MNEARHESLYQRLKARGLLDVVMRQLLEGEKNPQKMARWLKMEGVPCSQSAVYNLLRNHGFAWRYDQSKEVAASLDLPKDMSEAAAEVLRRKVQMFIFEADSLKEVRALAEISEGTEKLKQAERKVRVAEQTLANKVLETRLKGAEFIEELLSEASRLERLRAVHAESLQRGDGVKQRLDAIINEVWGEAAPATS